MSALPMTLNTTAETETAKIARGLRERDMELLADVVERCQHRLVRYLLYLTGRREYAEDLAQETWIRVLQRGSQYNGRQRFDPWLFAIARNLAIDYLRKKRKAVQTVSLPDDHDAVLLLPSSGPSPFEAAARSQDAMHLAGGGEGPRQLDLGRNRESWPRLEPPQNRAAACLRSAAQHLWRRLSTCNLQRSSHLFPK